MNNRKEGEEREKEKGKKEKNTQSSHRRVLIAVFHHCIITQAPTSG